MSKKAVLTLEIILAVAIVMGKLWACICLLSVLVVYCTNQINWLKEKNK